MYNDDDVFVKLVEEKQRESRNGEVTPYDEKNFGVSDEYIPETSENSSRSNSSIKKGNTSKKKIRKATMFLAVSAIVMSGLFYIDGSRMVAREVYNDIVEGGMVFKTDEDGNTYVAYGIDDMGMTAWQDVTIKDYENAREIAELCGHSTKDVYTTFNTLNFEDFKGAFTKEEIPSVEDAAHYIELGWNSRFEGRGR